MSDLEARIRRLERSTRTWCAVAIGLAAVALALLLWRTLGGEATADLVRAHRIEVVDDEGRVRVVLAEDPATEGERRAGAAGLRLFDRSGAERGGFVVLSDDSVVLGLDAPVGVGSTMRDRLALVVDEKGGAEVVLIDNETTVAVRLASPTSGEAGIEFGRFVPEDRVIRVRRIGFDGETTGQIALDGERK